jgi:hypothetical protein
MGRFWYWETHDWFDRQDSVQRTGFIPQALFWPSRRVTPKDRSPARLAERLDRFDRKIGHRFAWYFYCVHGNRIEPEAGKIIAAAVQKGDLHLRPKDEAVLMEWYRHPYLF